ncbi:MAG: magnesium transporter [Deltaproteobacteria bacterium]|nr:magnesium transporter [Deltaproteobacteria bacterium]
MAFEEREIPLERFKEFFASKDAGAATEALSLLHHLDVAGLLANLDDDEAVWTLSLLEGDEASKALLELDGPRREFLVSKMSMEDLVDAVEEMETDDAADVLSELPLEDAREILEEIEPKESDELKKLLVYPEDTAGGKMQAELVSVGEAATVKDAVEEVRRKSKEINNISNVFIVDSGGMLVGTVGINKLILNDEHVPVKSLIEGNIISVTTDVDQEEVAKMFQKYDLISMPVVDKDNRLVGRITIDDVVDVIEEEIFEDFYRMASLNVGERAMDRPWRSFTLRAPWLLMNLGTAFVVASVVKVFEGTIERLVILAVLMPIVAGLGGNAATQTITVIVRGLALGEIRPGSAKRVLVKEVIVGMSNGVLVGTVAIVVAYVFGISPMVGLLLFFAMAGNLVVAGVSATVIPLTLKWLGRDPALASSIFVTTCTDIGGFFIFLGLATVFMKAGFI